MRGALEKDQYSGRSIQHILRARTDGTNQVTKSRWKAWFAWCGDFRVDPLKFTNPELCSFLSGLFDSGLAVSTIKGYVSAIATTVRLSTKRETVVGNERLTRLLQGFLKQRPRLHSLVPKWDLTLVLMSLRKAPYEPLYKCPLRELTLKAAFLTQLALAARPGELTKLNRLIRVSRRSCTFTPVEGATVKSTDPGEVRLMKDITIPSLLEISGGDEDEMLLCPVRVLRRYDEVVATKRDKKKAFFLPISGTAKVSANTIATWIKLVIRHAYDAIGDSAPDLMLAGRSAHEVRALAASWAEFNNVSLSDIVNTCNWKRPTVFTSFYLRDVSSWAEAMEDVGPLVTAGAVLGRPADQAGPSR